MLDELLYADCDAKNVLREKMQDTMVSQVCDDNDLTIRKKNIAFTRIGVRIKTLHIYDILKQFFDLIFVQ